MYAISYILPLLRVTIERYYFKEYWVVNMF